MPYADELNFWMTGQSSPDKWIKLAKDQIKALGGRVLAEGFGSDDQGKAAFMLGFSIGPDRFNLIWPAMRPRNPRDEGAARLQAATMLYHYVKSVCLYAVVVGPRAAFFSHLLLPDGRTASQVASPELAGALPSVLAIEAPKANGRP